MKEISMLLDDLVSCGNKLIETAEALKAYYSSPEEAKTAPAEPKTEAPKEVVKEEAKTFTGVEVRAALADKAKVEDKKYKSDVKALVEKYSSDGTFTGITEDKYEALMKELEAIGNA